MLILKRFIEEKNNNKRFIYLKSINNIHDYNIFIYKKT